MVLGCPCSFFEFGSKLTFCTFGMARFCAHVQGVFALAAIDKHISYWKNMWLKFWQAQTFERYCQLQLVILAGNGKEEKTWWHPAKAGSS